MSPKTIGSQSHHRQRIRLRYTLALGLAVLALAGCGSSSSSSSNAASSSSSNSPASTSAASTSTSAGLSRAEAALATYSAAPTVTPVGTPFDASKAKGKSVWITAESLESPIELAWTNGIVSALKPYGVNVTTCDGKTTASDANRCMDEAVARKPNAIFNLSITPSIVPTGLAAAKAAGIPVVDGFDGTPVETQSSAWRPGVVAGVSFSYNEVGRLLADWVAASSHGTGHALFIESLDVPSTAPEVDGYKSEMAAVCPACHTTYKDIAIADTATGLGSLVTTNLTSDPSIKYVVVDYDGFVPLVETALKTSGLTTKVKVGSWNAIPPVMQLLKANTNVQADVGTPVALTSYAIADTLLRVMLGQKPPVWGAASSHYLGMRMFTPSNVKGIDVSTYDDTSQYQLPASTVKAAFTKLWGNPS